jgi:dTDP-glucose pyrophosphorylase
MRKNINKHILKSNISAKKAIIRLNNLENKFCLIVNEKDKFVGTLTDGDLRRGLLKNFSINDNVHKFAYKRPIFTKTELNTQKVNFILNKNYINCIPYLNNKNEIVDIYTLKKKEITSKIDNEMLIMAGGKGLRLRPLTNKTPKPLLLVNKRPIIERIILIAKKQGVTKFYVSINYLGHKIKKFLGDGKKYGVIIKYLEENKPLGTAGSIKLISNFKRSLIVSNADIISNINLKKMIKYHTKNKSFITIAAKVFNEKNNYGRLIPKGNKLQKIIEKPEKSFLINAGIYVLDPKIKRYFNGVSYLDMTDLINYLIKKEKKINIFPIHESWLDYGLKKNITRHLVK